MGFILLALSTDTVESIQACIFYILQYTITNLNAFIILLCVGYSLYLYVYEEKEDKKNLIDKNNSPVQLISQIKGYYYTNPFIAISFAITLFSFVGVPPIAGFFAKQMILSAALDRGYIFMSLVAILTSVIGAAYYLNLVKQIFFYKNNYKRNPSINNITLAGYVTPHAFSLRTYLQYFSNFLGRRNENLNTVANEEKKWIIFKPENITINSGLSSSMSVITLLLVLFIYIPTEWFNIVNILALILFKA